MAKLIGSKESSNYGESQFISKALGYLDDDHIIYWNRQLDGCEFDVCILLPGKGLLVVELKGWREENVLGVENSDAILVKTEDGTISARPQKQARSYRFSIESHIRQRIGKIPLVFQMVCFPQISRSFYSAHRLDVVTEESFTILKEDLADKVSFFSKINQALVHASHWKRHPFDARTMLEVRSLFETDIELNASPSPEASAPASAPGRGPDYSRFYFFAAGDGTLSAQLPDMTAQYLLGCKLYCVFSSEQQMERAVEAIDAALRQRGLVRAGEDLEIAFEENPVHAPAYSGAGGSFTAFHCSFSVLREPQPEITVSFCIRNGVCDGEKRALLNTLGDHSQFNAGQYLIEHADPEKNIIIRAGAGTGKTRVMISRIGYLCYTQNASLLSMADRIVMITFTNEAAEQMANKLKAYFRNCYLLTKRPDNLAFISQIDRMQISTIHSYARNLIAKLGVEYGYGVDLGVTSSEFHRRRIISDLLNQYIVQKREAYGDRYLYELGMPVYAIRNTILDFIAKLNNKSVDISSIKPSDFGNPPAVPHGRLHELLADIIPAIEREYAKELLERNQIHLGSMMSVLSRIIQDPQNAARIRELRKDGTSLHFLFVDEFQDTDDAQIDTLTTIAGLLDYKLFLVGDIKQCIYRFRGATENAFDRVKRAGPPDRWLEYTLRRNYRTDAALLDIFDRSFSAWGSGQEALLTYQAPADRLTGTRHYNDYIAACPDKFYRRLAAEGEAARIPLLIGEIRRLQRRIEHEETTRGARLSDEEKSIAILVRENWQADTVRIECAKAGIAVQTDTGGDLYSSQPALDMLTLVNALLHFDEADYLYHLVTSNFFKLKIPKSNLFDIRARIRSGGWRAKADEREQVNELIRFMNMMLANAVGEGNHGWGHIIQGLRTKPVLQAIREIYSTLEPWKNYSDDPQKRHYYQLNVDLLLEQLINACNIDRLTINTLQERLYHFIVAKVSVDSRTPVRDRVELPIQCITVHKSKGLEYGHVILPYCSAPMDYIKPSQMHICVENVNGGTRIGYSLKIEDDAPPLRNSFYNESSETEEKAREEARILYVAMTRAIRSFSWIALAGRESLSWQALIEPEA